MICCTIHLVSEQPGTLIPSATGVGTNKPKAAVKHEDRLNTESLSLSNNTLSKRAAPFLVKFFSPPPPPLSRPHNKDSALSAFAAAGSVMAGVESVTKADTVVSNMRCLQCAGRDA